MFVRISINMIHNSDVHIFVPLLDFFQNSFLNPDSIFKFANFIRWHTEIIIRLNYLLIMGNIFLIKLNLENLKKNREYKWINQNVIQFKRDRIFFLTHNIIQITRKTLLNETNHSAWELRVVSQQVLSFSWGY